MGPPGDRKMSGIPVLTEMGELDTEKDMPGGTMGPKDEGAGGTKHPHIRSRGEAWGAFLRASEGTHPATPQPQTFSPSLSTV